MAFTFKDWNINNCKGKGKVITGSNSVFTESEVIGLLQRNPFFFGKKVGSHRAMLLSTTSHALFSPE